MIRRRRSNRRRSNRRRSNRSRSNRSRSNRRRSNRRRSKRRSRKRSGRRRPIVHKSKSHRRSNRGRSKRQSRRRSGRRQSRRRGGKPCKKVCTLLQVCNTKTGRCVLRTSKIGKAYLASYGQPPIQTFPPANTTLPVIVDDGDETDDDMPEMIPMPPPVQPSPSAQGIGLMSQSYHILIEQIVNLSDAERNLLCRTNARAGKICRDPEVWKYLVEKKFGVYDKGTKKTWLSRYINLLFPNFYDVSEFTDPLNSNMDQTRNKAIELLVGKTTLSELDKLNRDFSKYLKYPLTFSVMAGIGQEIEEIGYYEPDYISDEFRDTIKGEGDSEIERRILAVYATMDEYSSEEAFVKRIDYAITKIPDLKDGDIVFTGSTYESRQEYGFNTFYDGELNGGEFFYGLDVRDYDDLDKPWTVMVQQWWTEYEIPEKLRHLDYRRAFETILAWDINRLDMLEIEYVFEEEFGRPPQISNSTQVYIN